MLSKTYQGMYRLRKYKLCIGTEMLEFIIKSELGLSKVNL